MPKHTIKIGVSEFNQQSAKSISMAVQVTYDVIIAQSLLGLLKNLRRRGLFTNIDCPHVDHPVSSEPLWGFSLSWLPLHRPSLHIASGVVHVGETVQLTPQPRAAAPIIRAGYGWPATRHSWLSPARGQRFWTTFRRLLFLECYQRAAGAELLTGKFASPESRLLW